ncbi:RNA polymerase I specific transcription initiation factor RRN3 protein [Zea mays]|uniref:RNA polymerase I specific transcription initiation factor RRN3 protein n=1 Tax=Zea mays TaxID=4577 RepID=A0A1D6MVS0_MAIZE|nr:RNA polymerase I specific transcription initiation factor RRN3 protein [Zea mays]
MCDPSSTPLSSTSRSQCVGAACLCGRSGSRMFRRVPGTHQECTSYSPRREYFLQPVCVICTSYSLFVSLDHGYKTIVTIGDGATDLEKMVSFVKCMLGLDAVVWDIIGSSLLEKVVYLLTELDVNITWEDILQDEHNKGIFDMELEDLAEDEHNLGRTSVET